MEILNMLVKFVCTSRKLAIKTLPHTTLTLKHLGSDSCITYFILLTHHHTFISISSTRQGHACVRIYHSRAIIVSTFSILSVVIALVTISIVKSYCTMTLILHS